MNSFPRNVVVKDGRVFTVDLARLDESAEVFEFRLHNFSSISPICYLVNDRPVISAENYLSGFVKNPVSLTLRDSTGRLVAIALNKLLEKPEAHHQATPNPTPTNEKPRLITSLLQDLEQGIDLFTTYNTKTIFAIDVVSVEKTYGQLGLATTLIRLSIDLAKANHAGAVKCTAVSKHAGKAAAKNGLETIRTIDYATYEYNGDKPLAKIENLLAEHPVACFMARCIE